MTGRPECLGNLNYAPAVTDVVLPNSNVIALNQSVDGASLLTSPVYMEYRGRRASRRERDSVFQRRQGPLAHQGNNHMPAVTTSTEGRIVAMLGLGDSAMMVLSRVLGKS